MVHEHKKTGEEKNYAFVLFKDKKSLELVLKQGEKHDIGVEVVECKETLLRDELKQKHLEKMHKEKKMEDLKRERKRRKGRKETERKIKNRTKTKMKKYKKIAKK